MAGWRRRWRGQGRTIVSKRSRERRREVSVAMEVEEDRIRDLLLELGDALTECLMLLREMVLASLLGREDVISPMLGFRK